MHRKQAEGERAHRNICGHTNNHEQRINARHMLPSAQLGTLLAQCTRFLWYFSNYEKCNENQVHRTSSAQEAGKKSDVRITTLRGHTNIHEQQTTVKHRYTRGRQRPRRGLHTSTHSI
jgi:hypothetical protein